MKRVIKILLIFVFLLFAGKGFSQTAVQSGDTLRIRQQQLEQQKEQQKEQEKLRQGEQQGQVQAGSGNANGQANGKAVKAVKQVKGSRPDMSKAKGARPPMIVRPSGSGVPKGVGKPGGAGRKGGR
ncbi:MAG: hypothetical protein JXR67_06900 [Bacteroidales bacterium]|nr:hypothetical protein [Bacteroidales bacterium]